MLAPPGFVLLWSTGFVGPKFGLPYIEPMTFLSLRFALAAGALALLALCLHAPWPRTPGEIGHLAVSGALLHAGYLGGVFAALDAGAEPGVIALIAGVQPALVLILTRLAFGEQFRCRQYAGAVLGLAGVTFTVWHELTNGIGTAAGVGFAIFALIAISLGTVYQKRYCGRTNLVTSSLVQFLVAFAVVGILAVASEDGKIIWSWPLVITTAYLAIALSVGSILLFYALLRAGTAHQVSSLFFLVPPTTGLLSAVLLGESLSRESIIGMFIAALGVALVSTVSSQHSGR
ncbi:MAG TPA: DMT family transporter [Hyphomicrobiaceae bacterium]